MLPPDSETVRVGRNVTPVITKSSTRKPEGLAAAPPLFTVGVNFTQRRVNHVAFDASVGIMPYVLAFSALGVGTRVGLAAPLEVAPDVLLMPSAGLALRARLLRCLPERRRPCLRTEMKHRTYPDGYRIDSVGPAGG